MDRLRALFAGLGFDDVATFIASGNVIFSASSGDADTLEADIEEHLAGELGYEVPTFVRSPAELEAVATFTPPGSGQADDSGTSLYVMFLRTPVDDTLASTFAGLESETDRFHVSGREVYWHIQGKVSESPLFGGALEKATRGVETTMRNMTTVRKLVAKVGDAS